MKGCLQNFVALIVIGAVTVVCVIRNSKPQPQASSPLAPPVVSSPPSSAAPPTQPPPIPSRDTARLTHDIMEAPTVAKLKVALMMMFSEIQDVKWYSPSNDDPESVLEIIFKETDDLGDKRKELNAELRKIGPILVKAQNPWQVLNLNNGFILNLERPFGRMQDLSTLSDDAINELNKKSGELRLNGVR